MSLNPTEMLMEDPPNLEKGFEWVDGQAVEKPMGAQSSHVNRRLSTRLGAYVDDNDLGFVVDSECGFRIFPKKPRQIRKPDMSYIAKGRLPNNKLPEGDVTIAPDLAVEVISPNDVAQEIELRISDLHSAGIRLLWIVYPNTRTIWVLRKDGSAVRLTEDQELTGEDVVAGFRVPVATLFQGL
jgi:Uma2 family endonuclease